MIKFVCFDYDGVFTDGKISLNSLIKKSYNVKDGYGISLLKNNNIKVGIITSFGKNKEYNTNLEFIVKHLNIDKFSDRTKNKLEVLEQWVNEYNFNFSEVAYIGDDIPDIPILMKVGISACPNDAIDECKNIVNYICNKKGGDGCIREFIEYILNNSEKNNVVNQIKNEVNYQLNNFPNIDNLVNIIHNLQGNLYTAGIGKSENIALLSSNLLKSIGIKSFNLNLTNCLHGDIGVIDDKDIIIFFTKSGNTKEILEIIDNFKCKKVLVSCSHSNRLSKFVDVNITLPLNNELINDNNINYIPSNSLMINVIFTNILIQKLIIKKQLQIDKYKTYHPAGNIGTKLKKIKDIRIDNFPKLIFNEEVFITDILLEMTKYKIGCIFIINNKEQLIGLLSDGDIRRLILKKNKITNILLEDLNTNFYFIENENIFINEIDKNKFKKYKFIPIIENNILKSIIDVRDLD